jgi:hypothetical protein
LWKGSLTHPSTYHFRGFYSKTFPRSEVLTSFLNSRSRLFLPVSSVVNIFLQILGLYRNWSQSRDPGKSFNASNSRFHTALRGFRIFSQQTRPRPDGFVQGTGFLFYFVLIFLSPPDFPQEWTLRHLPFSAASRILFDGLNCQTSRDEGQRSMVLRACWGPERRQVNRAPHR